MSTATEHAETHRGSTELLEEFRRLNPNLEEPENNRPFCNSLMLMLTPRHRWDGNCCRGHPFNFCRETCLIDHPETWRDRETGLWVLVAHPYCRYNPENPENPDHHDHRYIQEELANRGLAYRASRGSWYAPGSTTLVVTARVDIAERLRLPEGPDNPDLGPAQDMTEICSLIDWRNIQERQLRKEAWMNDQDMVTAAWEEALGEPLNALRHYTDNAYVNRTAGFHELALDQLVQARRIITAQPWLDIEFLHFETEADRRYICGTGEPLLETGELQARLMAIRMPEGWTRFVANATPERRRASAEIRRYGEPWGNAQISQGGNRNLWAASVESNTGTSFGTLAGDEYQNTHSPKNFMMRTPEEAVEAAFEIYRRYEELTERWAR